MLAEEEAGLPLLGEDGGRRTANPVQAVKKTFGVPISSQARRRFQIGRAIERADQKKSLNEESGISLSYNPLNTSHISGSVQRSWKVKPSPCSRNSSSSDLKLLLPSR